MSFHSGIFVFDGADEQDVIGPFRVLRGVGEEVELVAEEARPIRMSFDLTIEPTATFADAPPLDVLIVPGGGSAYADRGRRYEQHNPAALEFVRTRSAAAQVTASVCTGALILAHAGLLAGRRGNTHWMWRDELTEVMKERGEDFTLVPERVVWDGDDLVTGGGVTSGIDVGLALVDRFLGPDARSRIEDILERETPE